jgi:hypothetical protein
MESPGNAPGQAPGNAFANENLLGNPKQDRYGRNGETGAPQERRAGPASQGPDRYGRDGETQVEPGATPDGRGHHCKPREVKHQPTAHELAWRPDPAHAKPEWVQAHEAQKNQPLDVDQRGIHIVKYGETLDDIARRKLVGEGKTPSAHEIAAEAKMLAANNVDAYPGLAKNPDLVQPGWEIRTRPCPGTAPAETQVQTEPPPRPQPPAPPPQRVVQEAGPPVPPPPVEVVPQPPEPPRLAAGMGAMIPALVAAAPMINMAMRFMGHHGGIGIGAGFGPGFGFGPEYMHRPRNIWEARREQQMLAYEQNQAYYQQAAAQGYPMDYSPDQDGYYGPQAVPYYRQTPPIIIGGPRRHRW